MKRLLKNRSVLAILGIVVIWIGNASCGPGIQTVAPPGIQINSPVNGTDITLLTGSYSGTCTFGLDITVAYDPNVSGAKLVACKDDGTFYFPVTYKAIAGAINIGVSQTDRFGNTGTSTNQVNFVRDSFNVANGFDGAVRAVLLNSAAGGGFYGGDFTEYLGTTTPRIVQLDELGSIVPAFTMGTGFDNTVNSIAFAPDSTGDLYVGGAFANYNGTGAAAIARVTSAGVINPSFLAGSGFDGVVESILPTSDNSGDIYVVGAFTHFKGVAVGGIVRLTSIGGFSPTFVPGTGFVGTAFTLLAAPDTTTDIYVGGSFSSYNGTSSVGMIRLTSLGAVNGAFNVGTGFVGAVTTLAAVKDTTTDLYVGGQFTSYNATAALHILRVTATGIVNPVFVSGAGFNGNVTSLAVADTSGAVFIGGTFATYKTIAAGQIVKLTSAGEIDTTFIDGAGFNGPVYSLALLDLTGGDLFVGGAFTGYANAGVNRLARVGVNGILASSFNSGAGFDSTVLAVSPLADQSGDIYVGGNFLSYNGVSAPHLAKVDSSGLLADNFSIGAGFNGAVTAITQTNDGTGDILVGGNFTSVSNTSAINITRLNSSGGLVSSFSSGAGFDGPVAAITMASDKSGDFYVAGSFSTYQTTSAPSVIKLHATGGQDTAFAYGTGFNGAVNAVLPLPTSANYLFAGVFTTYQGILSINRITGLLSSGSPGTIFGAAGFDNNVNCLSMDSNNIYYAGGTFTGYGASARVGVAAIAANGSVVSTFNPGAGPNGAVLSVAATTDGSGDVYIGGSFSTYQTAASAHLVRLNASANPSSTFTLGAGFDGDVNVIVPAVDGSGDVYVGGNFHRFNGSHTDSLIRLSPTGPLD